MRRYDEFARYLCGRGYAVCGDDHIGHGASAAPDKRGCMPARNGNEVLIDDEHALRALVSAEFPADTPYVFFGHSMGSFITRPQRHPWRHGNARLRERWRYRESYDGLGVRRGLHHD